MTSSNSCLSSQYTVDYFIGHLTGTIGLQESGDYTGGKIQRGTIFAKHTILLSLNKISHTSSSNVPYAHFVHTPTSMQNRTLFLNFKCNFCQNYKLT